MPTVTVCGTVLDPFLFGAGLDLLGRRARCAVAVDDVIAINCKLMVGLGKTYIGDVECGKRNAGFENLCKITEGVGVSVAYLVDFDGEIRKKQP